MVLGVITDQRDEWCSFQSFTHFVTRLMGDKVSECVRFLVAAVGCSFLFVQVTEPSEVCKRPSCATSWAAKRLDGRERRATVSARTPFCVYCCSQLTIHRPATKETRPKAELSLSVSLLETCTRYRRSHTG